MSITIITLWVSASRCCTDY